jgi:predicted nucleotidyltransferase
MNHRVTLPEKELKAFCQKHHIKKMSLFGSALRDDYGPDSDLDVLVEFEEGHVPGLKFFSMQDELSRILKCKVDLNTPGFLSRHFRDQVLSEAEVCYASEKNN